jgi:RimJ/RimL family protein N-acetyltransferase
MQTFETERLLMRPLRPDDQAFYCGCYTDPILMQHIGEPFSPETALRGFHSALKAASLIPVRNYTWAMQEKATGTPVGLLAMYADQIKSDPVTATLGTITLTRFQNRGFTAEAIRELSNIVFDKTGLDALFVKHKAGNDAVAGVMTKLGYLPDIPDSPDNRLWVLRRHHWQTWNSTATPE